MSSRSKIVLGIACLGTSVMVVYVHWKQWADKKSLQDGVLRDVERQQKRKVQNLYWLQQQIEMSKILKEQQSRDDVVSFQLLEDSKKSE